MERQAAIQERQAAIQERQAAIQERQAYDTDLTDEQWALVEKKYNDVRSPHGKKPRGRKPEVPRRDIFNAILYRLKTGCQWRNLPHDFPHWNNTAKTHRRWIKNGLWEKIHDELRRDVRKKNRPQ